MLELARVEVDVSSVVGVAEIVVLLLDAENEDGDEDAARLDEEEEDEALLDDVVVVSDDSVEELPVGPAVEEVVLTPPLVVLNVVVSWVLEPALALEDVVGTAGGV